MQKTRFLLTLCLPALLLAGCGKDEMEDSRPDIPAANGDIKFEIGFAPATRVATTADFSSTWEEGDEIGIFAVKHGDPLAASGNYIHNVKLTYNSGTWTGPAYWPKDNISALNFYAYYPYNDNGGNPEALNPTAIVFNVKTDQSAAADYSQSDLLTAKSDNSGGGWAKGSTVTLTFSHALAMVQVTIDDRVGALDVNEGTTVKLRGVKPFATLNLGANGGPAVELAANGNDAANIIMHRVADASGYVYRALVPAQTVADGQSIFRIVSGDVLLNGPALTGDLTMATGQAETFTQETPHTALPLIAAKDKTFSMGEINVATPVHKVTFTKDFRMGRYQVTNAQYAAFLNDKGVQGQSANGYFTGSLNGNKLIESSGASYDWGLHWEAGRWVPVPGYENHPVVNVTWYGADEYAKWVGGALPTEAQWEYACRAGSTASYSMGAGNIQIDEATIGDYAWYFSNSGGQTHKVGGKKPNAYGLYDMHGNVWEWCSDWYGNYGSEDATDPVGSATGSGRVMRGGSWLNDAKLSRSAYRGNTSPDIANLSYGFRVVFVP